MKNTSARIVLCLAVLALATATAFAGEGTKNGVVIINGGKNAVATPGPQPAHAVNPNPEGLKTIFSNLGTGTDVYFENEGSTICGPDSGICTQWVATAFTPKSKATVTKIKVAVGWFTGTNAAIVSLNQDSGGLPGKAIHTWQIKNMYAFGTCCTLDVVKSKKGLAVKKGKQYWVVVSTSSSSNLGGAWNFTFNGASGPWAFSTDLGQTWTAETANVQAFGVFGTK